MSDFLDIQTLQLYYKQEEDGMESGLTVSAFCAELWAGGFDGYGLRKTRCGPRYIQNIKSDGCMPILANNLGITQDCMQKVSQLTDGWSCADYIPLDWGKKMSYCIAFSIDGATDVTRRYVRNPWEYSLPRDRCPEEVLVYLLEDIRRQRRARFSVEQRGQLAKEDRREEKELQSFIIQALVKRCLSMKLSSVSPDAKSQHHNVLAERTDGKSLMSFARMIQSDIPTAESPERLRAREEEQR